MLNVKNFNCSNCFKQICFQVSILISEKYDYVGRLLKPGEQPNNYSDEEDDVSGAGEKNKDD